MMLEKFYVPVWGESGHHYIPRNFFGQPLQSIPQALPKKHFLNMSLAKERAGFGAGGSRLWWCLAQMAAVSRTELLSQGWALPWLLGLPLPQVSAAFSTKGLRRDLGGSWLVTPS